MRIQLLLVWLSTAALSACGGDDGDDAFARVGATFEGIYTLNGYTLNEAACDAEGPIAIASAGGDTYLVMNLGSFFGIGYLNVMSCAEPADCRDKAARVETEFVAVNLSYSLASVRDDDSLTGKVGVSGFSDGSGVCSEGGVEDIVLTRAGTEITLELRGRYADHSADAEGVCWTDDGAAAAASSPCTRLEVVRGSFVEPL